MSKRKNRSGAPNLPQETLERARRQAAIERGEMPPDPEPEAEAQPEASPAEPKLTVAPRPAPPANPYRTVSASQRRTVNEARTGSRRSQVVGTRRREKKDDLDQETITELLAHPTKTVTEDELRRDYAYVVADLRSMGLLAVGLMVTLVALALLLPQ